MPSTNLQTQPAHVAVLVCSYNSKPYLSACLQSLLASNHPGIQTRVVVVDDASTDSTPDFLRQNFPQMDCLALPSNLGFAGANNAGWEFIQKKYPHTQYLVLLNADTHVAPDWLPPLVACLQANPAVAAAQAKILLHHEPHKLNTAGNRSHYLGFGYMRGYNQPDSNQFDYDTDLDFASGAALIVSAPALRSTGLFDPSFYMYLEDAELSWKLRQLGREIRFVPQSRVYHHYTPKAPTKYYYYLERNRWLLLLTYYKLPTLLVLTPALILMELGQLLYSLLQGALPAKLRSYAFFLSPKNTSALLQKRRTAQQKRIINDRLFMTRFSGAILFEAVDHPLLRYLGNPLLAAYWAMVKHIIVW